MLFDFDGTLTKKDTLFEFTRFAVGNTRFFLGLIILSAPLVLQKLKVISAQRAKEMFLSYYFKQIHIEDFNRLCESFCASKLPGLIRQKASHAIIQHQNQGSRIIILSASAANWIEPWASVNKIETIATELETFNNRITGKINGTNCNGDEKVRRLKIKVNIKDYNEIIAYGDTSGDLPMLNLADIKYYKPFR